MDRPTLLRFLIALVAAFAAGRMVFEGLRAFSQDEATRTSAAQLQQLGAWARVLVESGLQPRSAATNTFFVVYGSVWLALAGAYALGQPWARAGLIAAALGSLWYLGTGTLLALVLLVLLWFAGR
jgi:hypothetical protein